MTLVKTPEEADAAIVFMESPHPMIPGYNQDAGYVPISLQYRPYTAKQGRASSLASGDPYCFENPDRTYLGKTNTCANESHLTVFEETVDKMAGKPVIAVIDLVSPMILAEVEPKAAAILVGFELQKQAYLDMVFGNDEPSGLLPFQMPADMETVENSREDVPFDCVPYTDEEGHVYDFAYGMNYKGIITDDRTKRYR